MDSKKEINRKISVAPMMDCTDRHDRFFLRLMSKNVMLYTEMVATKSAIHGDRRKILSFSPEEKPLALQVGGSNKDELAEVAKLAEQLPLEDMLLTRMKRNFESVLETNGGEMFCTEKDMVEFYGHGVEILKFIRKKRAQYFSKKGYELIGIEVPIDYDMPNNIKFIGYIDVVIRDTVRDVIKIYDIKTSTMGWNKYMKADKNKTDQLLLYKQFYSKKYNRYRGNKYK